MLWRHCLSELDCCKAELTVLPRVMMALGTVMLHLAQVGWRCLGSFWPAPFNHPVYNHCWTCQEHACAVEVPCIRYVIWMPKYFYIFVKTSLAWQSLKEKLVVFFRLWYEWMQGSDPEFLGDAVFFPFSSGLLPFIQGFQIRTWSHCQTPSNTALWVEDSDKICGVSFT